MSTVCFGFALKQTWNNVENTYGIVEKGCLYKRPFLCVYSFQYYRHSLAAALTLFA